MLPCEVNAMCAVATGSGGSGRATAAVLLAASVVTSAVHFEKPPGPLFLSKLREGHHGTCSGKTTRGAV